MAACAGICGAAGAPIPGTVGVWGVEPNKEGVDPKADGAGDDAPNADGAGDGVPKRLPLAGRPNKLPPVLPEGAGAGDDPNRPPPAGGGAPAGVPPKENPVDPGAGAGVEPNEKPVAAPPAGAGAPPGLLFPKVKTWFCPQVTMVVVDYGVS